MSKDEIIAMAREAGIEVHERKQQARIGSAIFTGSDSTDQLTRFAEIVAAKEREASAKTCEAWAAGHAKAAGGCTYASCDFVAAAHDCAEAIRKQGAA